MTDTKTLRDKIEEKGLKLKSVAKALGISPYSLQKKIDNDGQFWVSEVEKLSELLGLTAEEKISIFFNV